MLAFSLLSPTALVLPSTTAACRSPAASPLRVPAICMEEEEQTIASRLGVKEPNLFTLEEQNDGFDDVRQAVIAAKKDRSKALGVVKEKYGPAWQTASRWTKVIADEVGGVELQAPDLKAPGLKVPRMKVPELKVPKLDVSKVVPTEAAKGAFFGFLDGAAEQNQKRKAAEKQKLADQKAARGQQERAAKSNFFRKSK